MINFMNNLRISTKLVGGFAIVILLLLISVGFGYMGTKWLSESMTHLYFDQTVQIKNLGNAKIGLGQIKSNMLIYVEIPDGNQVPITSENKNSSQPITNIETKAINQPQCAKCHPANVSGNHHLQSGQTIGDVYRCLACHSQKAIDPMHGGGGNIAIAQTAAPSSSKGQLECAKCHLDVVNSTHKLQVNEKPGTANRCLNCHQAIADSPMHGTGVMTEQECASCHPADVVRTQRSALVAAIQKDIALVDQVMKDYRNLKHSDAEIADLAVFDAAWKEYLVEVNTAQIQVDQGKKMSAVRSLTDGAAQKKRLIMDQSIDRIIAALHQEAQMAQNDGTQTFQTSTFTLIGAGILGVLFAGGLGYLITLSINKPLLVISGGLLNFQKGDLNRNRNAAAKMSMTNRADEIGIAGKGLVSAEQYLHEMADVARKIADGDLAVQVTPRSQKDEFGLAFAQMIVSLRGLISKVIESADNLEAASNQMTETSELAREASNQIISTIREVSIGINQQTGSVKGTLSTVSQMERAIDGVAKGAQEQSQALVSVSKITSRISSATQQAAGNAATVTERSIEASSAARLGSKTVEDTLTGMHNIKERVGLSAAKVLEMGKRSDQISSIVETIDEIASQTNLLALNAAIEAARAGEQGKGFAVVADEVRKLAERSSLAAREIGQLVRGIQTTVTEAVNAMEIGTREVDAGVASANNAGTSLENILKAAEVVNDQAEEARRMTFQVKVASDELVSAIERVSMVVEENTASAEQMAASSIEVTRAMQDIAKVSEYNGAAVANVSSGAEEISAQVDDVADSARLLSQMANQLQTVLTKFRLNK
jgi:methyl-accepting chemotaxis protein